MPEQIIETAKQKGFTDFIGLMKEVAELPKEQQEKVTCYTQGVIAATKVADRKADNE